MQGKRVQSLRVSSLACVTSMKKDFHHSVCASAKDRVGGLSSAVSSRCHDVERLSVRKVDPSASGFI